ncbi:hypothetical protein M5D96_010844, partial [Drosophila gunungcola]
FDSSHPFEWEKSKIPQKLFSPPEKQCVNVDTLGNRTKAKPPEQSHPRSQISNVPSPNFPPRQSGKHFAVWQAPNFANNSRMAERKSRRLRRKKAEKVWGEFLGRIAAETEVLTSAGCPHEIDKWAAANFHAPRHSGDRGPTAKVCGIEKRKGFGASSPRPSEMSAQKCQKIVLFRDSHSLISAQYGISITAPCGDKSSTTSMNLLHTH